MEIKLLTTPSIVKQNSYINEHVQDSTLKIAMQRAQDLHIEPILGTVLYQKILAGGLAAPYSTLLTTYILPVFFAYCEYEVAPHVTTEIRNQATGKSSNADINAASEQELNYIRSTYKAAAKKYESRLIAHLCDHKADYPEYSENEGHEQLKPMTNKYTRTTIVTGYGEQSDWTKNSH
jgi:hypothetical protein